MSANDNAPELTDLERQVLRKITGCGVTVDCDDAAAVRAAINRLLELGLIEINTEVPS